MAALHYDEKRLRFILVLVYAIDDESVEKKTALFRGRFELKLYIFF